MPFRILIVDDKIDDRGEEISALPELLRKAGYEVRTTADESEAYDLFWEYRPDLVVLDIIFGSQPAGVEICDAIRRNKDDTPIILVTRFRKETQQVLAGFDAGADDYVILPCDNREIMARVRANLPAGAVVIDDYMHVDFAGNRVWVKRNQDWCQVHLSPLLWELLDVLLLNAGITVITTSIKDRVWGKAVSDGALAVAIRRLREKLEPDPSHPIYIEAVRSIGYQFKGTPVRASSEPPAGQIHAPSGSTHPNTYGWNGEGTAAVQDDAVLKSRLMAQAEVAVGRLLAEKRESAGLQPSDMERLVRAAGQYMVERFTSLLVEAKDRERRTHA